MTGKLLYNLSPFFNNLKELTPILNPSISEIPSYKSEDFPRLPGNTALISDPASIQKSKAQESEMILGLFYFENDRQKLLEYYRNTANLKRS